jgi:hypothetical protein
MTSRPANPLGLLVVAIVSACLGLAVLVAALWPAKQPTYNGRSISFWFKRLPEIHGLRSFAVDPEAAPSSKLSYAQPSTSTTVSYGFPLNRSLSATSTSPGTSNSAPDYRTALKAIRVMGTNALPFLIRKLERRPPSRSLQKLRYYAAKWPAIGALFCSADTERAQAVTGLLVLCPLPPDALQKICTLSLDFYGPAWSQAGDLLKANKDPRLVRDALSSYE